VPRIRRPAALALSALLAACQPLPHPFADDRPPAALLRIPDTAGVSIAPIEGQPQAIAAKLGAAAAAALLKREIPASDKTTGRGSYRLYGRVFETRATGGRSAVTALWRLYDAKGRTLGERHARLEATAADRRTGIDAIVERLAALSADAVAPLLTDEAPPAAATRPQQGGRVRVAVRKVSGAPGDGATSLAKAITTVLQRQDLTIVDAAGKADLYVEGEVAVAPVARDKQHVKILWRVRRADGAEIGTVGQENDVPRGLLNGAWGDVAYNIAIAAGEGLRQLLARGMPPAKS